MAGRYGAQVVDVVLISRLIALTGLGALTLALLLVVAGAFLRFRGRRPGRLWARAVSLTVGLHVGTLVLISESNPLERAVILTVIGAVTIGLLWRERRVQAGLFLAASAVPWTVLWAYYAVMLVTADPDFEPFGTWTSFVFGLVPLVAGLGLALAGDPPRAEPDRAPAGGPPDARRIGLVAQVVLAPESVGPFPISELAAFVTTVVTILIVGALGLPDPARPLAQIAAGALLGHEARFIARPARARRAHEAFSWLADWEIKRGKALTGRGLQVTRRGVRAWLDAVPDRPETRWMRVEYLAFLGRLDEARAVAATMPEGTPWERFEKISTREFVEWLAGGNGGLDEVRAAAAELDPADEDSRLRAEVAIAIGETRRLAAEHGPEAGLPPLLAVRDRLGPRADGQLRRALWRMYLPISLGTAIVLTLVGSLD